MTLLARPLATSPVTRACSSPLLSKSLQRAREPILWEIGAASSAPKRLCMQVFSIALGRITIFRFRFSVDENTREISWQIKKRGWWEFEIGFSGGPRAPVESSRWSSAVLWRPGKVWGYIQGSAPGRRCQGTAQDEGSVHGGGTKTGPEEQAVTYTAASTDAERSHKHAKAGT